MVVTEIPSKGLSELLFFANKNSNRADWHIHRERIAEALVYYFQ
jgi:hypothetical protein